MLLADMIDAAEAQALGLVTWVKSSRRDRRVRRRSRGPPRGRTARQRSPQSKALLNDGADATLREALANEARAQPGNFATADSTEAYAAFAEKRDAEFTGRWAVSPRTRGAHES